jgi:hypothetical protein
MLIYNHKRPHLRRRMEVGGFMGCKANPKMITATDQMLGERTNLERYVVKGQRSDCIRQMSTS